MHARERLTRWPRRLQPSATARAAIATIQRMLVSGCTAEEVAQARAQLDAMNKAPRQGALPLKVRT
ncbi:hypothetical protein [Rhodanobacter sp. OR92]|uniref:hypothetical protein n=1 Tax=Rhodanobacter sp. OR92 TaxID=1076524 RepID=UPI0004140F8E|nr:hypothetical protein [Rhodanobacter sp. OR92]